MHTDTSDISLLQAWQRHRDAEAFHAIVSRHARLVYNTCRHILRNDADAADVSQECFLCLATSPPKIQYSLSGWLHRLATHRSLDHLKAANRRRDREIRYAREAVVAGNEEQADLMAMVDEAIDALPDDLRLPLIEHFLRQKSHQEVADGLGIPRRTVTYRINSGVGQLRDRLKRKGVAVPGTGLVLALEAQDAGAAEVPAYFYEALGRHALAGADHGAIQSMGTGLATVVLMKKGWIAAAVMVGLALAWWLAAGNNLSKTPRGTSTPPPVAETRETDESNDAATGGQIEPVASFPPEQATPGEETRAATAGKVMGRVYDEDSNAPIPDAVVVIAPEAGSAKTTCTTNASGNYESPELPAGAYLIYRDETPGYPSTKRTGVGKRMYDPVIIQGTRITLRKDTTLDFPVRKGVVVAGRVLDKRERGIPGATVSAGGYGEGNAQTTESDSEGRFFLAGLSPTSDLHVRATKEGFGEAALSKISLIAPGNEDLTIHLPNEGSVSGVVVNSAGAPLNSARIEAVHFQHYGAWTFDYPSGISGKDGNFSVEGLAPGRYTFQIFPAEYVSFFDQNATALTLAEGEHLRDVKLVLNNGGEITLSGRIADLDGHPIEGATIMFHGPVERTVKTDAEGRYRAEGFIEGDYSLNPFMKGYVPTNDEHIAFKPILASRDDLDFTLKRQNLCVEGVVLDSESGKPLSGIEVIAIATPARFSAGAPVWYEAERFSNADGSFAVDVRNYSGIGSEADEARCVVYARKDGYAYRTEEIALSENGETMFVEIALEHGQTICGIVTDHHGAPVFGAVIAEGRVANDRAWGRNDLTTTNNEGRFEVAGLPESVNALTAVHPSYANASIEITNAAEELRIVFGPAGEIRGRVFMDGSPLPLARLSLEPDLGTMNTSENRYGSTDQSGAYRFGQLVPGEYRVVTSRTEGAHFVFNFTASAVVNEGESTTVDLHLTSGTTLSGTVLADGQGTNRGRVTYEVETEGGTAEHVPHINADGSWRIDNATPGAGVLNVQGAIEETDDLRQTIEIELAPGEERVIDIDLADESDGEPSKE